jgi:hypothetical protein
MLKMFEKIIIKQSGKYPEEQAYIQLYFNIQS